jgi:complement component 1 Q subcomponent-binding protein
MFSLRTLARAAPRVAVPRIASAMPSRILLRTSGAMAATARLPTSSSSFSTSAPAQQKKHDVEEYDEATYELANKLDSEIQFENEIAADQGQEPTSVKDWLENSDFELVDTPGRQDVKLVRDFQDEKITVTFSIGGLDPMDDMYNDNMEEDNMPEDEDALSDPDHSDNLSPSQRNKRNKGTLSRPALEEEDSELADDEDGLIDEEAMSPPLNINIVIEKPGKAGSLSIDAAAQHGTLVVDNMAYYDNATTAKGQTQDSMWAQQGVYAGPPFHSLDEDLQLIVERYLEERGIGQALALFAIDYIDTKEQREYVRWLKNVKSFVERKP